MKTQRSKNISDKKNAKEWINSHKDIKSLFSATINTLKRNYSGSDDGYINITPPQYRFNKHPYGRIVVCAQSKRVIVKFHPIEGINGCIFYIYEISELSKVMEYINNFHKSYHGFFGSNASKIDNNKISSAQYKNILEYRKHPHLCLCARAHLVTGIPKNDKLNRELLAKNQTGHWRVRAGRVNRGDAIFVMLPNLNLKNGYPRELYVGIIEEFDVLDNKTLFSVKSFLRLENIDSEVLKFLNGKAPPMGNTVLEVWNIASENKISDVSFYNEVSKAIKESHESRKARLEKAPRLPSRELVMVERFHRNPDVVAEVLYQAQALGGKCGHCEKKAPFERRDGTPYLEVHHIIPLASGGDDTVDNAIALCPNCHRKWHYQNKN
jgi:hypothetical protein